VFGATAPLYFPEPERCPATEGSVDGGNLLEFVCYDASVGQGKFIYQAGRISTVFMDFFRF
jgi:hypothetical protein